MVPGERDYVEGVLAPVNGLEEGLEGEARGGRVVEGERPFGLGGSLRYPVFSGDKKIIKISRV